MPEMKIQFPASLQRRMVGALVGALLGVLVEHSVISRVWAADSELHQMLGEVVLAFFTMVGYSAHKLLKRWNLIPPEPPPAPPAPPAPEHVWSPPGEVRQCWCGDYHMTTVHTTCQT